MPRGQEIKSCAGTLCRPRENRVKKCQFYQNIAFIIYTKTYLLLLFLGYWSEPFSKKYTVLVVILIFILWSDWICFMISWNISVSSRGTESYDSILTLALSWEK